MNPPEADAPREPPQGPDDSAHQPPLIYQSQEILQGRREIWIEHAGQMYRLRTTSRGKLILTK